MSDTETPLDLITQAEAARIKNVKRQRIHTLIKKGQLKSYNKKVSRKELEELKPKNSGRPRHDKS